MQYTEMRQDLVAAVGEDVDALYDAWRAEHDLSDDAFLGYLHQIGRIGAQTLRTLHAAERLKLSTLAGLQHDRATMFPEDLDDSEIVSKGPAPEASYTYLGKVGSGAMGEVFVARDEDLQRKVAFKQMSDRTAEHPGLAARFYNEAQITAQLDHPNIVPVYALETAPDGRLGYTMKLIRGHTLQDLIDEARRCYDLRVPLPDESGLEARLEHFLKVCDALHYAHSRGVVHRDLKPENIMVGPFREVYVMDWGIARLIDHSEGDLLDPVDLSVETGGLVQTQLGAVIGTPAFLSPEQADGLNGPLDGRSDQFALGLILFELVSLQRALTGPSALALVVRAQDADLDPLLHYGGEAIAPELVGIIARATQRQVDDRYPSVEALAEDLRRYLRGEAVLAAPDQGVRRLYRWVSHHQNTTFATVLALILLAGLVAISALLFSADQTRKAQAHQDQLTRALTAVSRQGASIDARLVRYEGLALTLAEAAVEGLSAHDQGHGEPVPDFLFEADFVAPDQVVSGRYGRTISLHWPVVRWPADVDAAEVSGLLPLRRQALRVLLSSQDATALSLPWAEQASLIKEAGVPLAMAYLALEDGLFMAFPGHGGFPPGYDGRRQPWYKLALGKQGAQWGNPHVDPGGLGLMLPCSVALTDDQGEFRGVAAVELTFDYLIGALLEAPSLAGRAEAFIVDDHARVVLRSGQSRQVAARRVGRKLRLQSFPIPGLAQHLQHTPSGWYEVETDGVVQVVLYYRMDAVGWTYVVSGPAAVVLQ